MTGVHAGECTIVVRRLFLADVRTVNVRAVVIGALRGTKDTGGDSRNGTDTYSSGAGRAFGSANTHMFPFYVSLRAENTMFGRWQHFCSGTIIGARTVLTSSECIDRFAGANGESVRA